MLIAPQRRISDEVCEKVFRIIQFLANPYCLLPGMDRLSGYRFNNRQRDMRHIDGLRHKLIRQAVNLYRQFANFGMQLFDFIRGFTI